MSTTPNSFDDSLDEILEAALRKARFNGWELGKEQAAKPTVYTLGDDTHLKELWDDTKQALEPLFEQYHLTHPNNGDTQVDELEQLIEKRVKIASTKTKSDDRVVQIAWLADGIDLWHRSNGKRGHSPVKARRYIISSITRLLAERDAALRQHIDKVVEAVIGEDETVNSHYVPNGNYEVVNKESEPAYFRNLERAKQRLRYKQLKGES